MIYLILFFLFASLYLYVVFGGADFGAGILELFSQEKDKKTVQNITYKAIGPVWEANHIWLILVIVILFTGFPQVYSLISIHLHIPLMLMLLGIILRGTAFVFRHYDAYEDGSQKIYTNLFVYGSFMTPLFLGIIAGASISGKIDPQALDFYSAYIGPWFDLFPLSVGLFFCAISAYLAAVFLAGELKNKSFEGYYVKIVKQSLFSLLGGGVLVFLIAFYQDFDLFDSYLRSPISLLSMGIGSLLIFILLRQIKHQQYWQARGTACAQIFLVLMGWVSIQYPTLVKTTQGGLDLFASQAPAQSLYVLGISLIAGSCLIFPALYYLFKVFKS